MFTPAVSRNRYRRAADDLEMTMRISLLESLVGFEQSFVHLDGAPVEVKKNDVTYDGQTVTIHNKGMPRKDSPSQHGNLRIKFVVSYPAALNETQKGGAKRALEGVRYTLRSI